MTLDLKLRISLVQVKVEWGQGKWEEQAAEGSWGKMGLTSAMPRGGRGDQQEYLPSRFSGQTLALDVSF